MRIFLSHPHADRKLAATLRKRLEAEGLTISSFDAALPRFEERKSQLQAAWSGRAPWADIVVAALETAPRL
jgi:NAD(P)H-dependent FMN reductase